MFFTQYYLDCLSQASYLIGDETTGQAVVVDPRRDVAEYLADADAHGLTIVGVIDTHFHADFLAGHLELAAATGAWIGFGQRAEADFPIRKLADGERISLGDVTLRDPGDPGPHPGVDQRPGLRARRRRGALRRADRRRAVHRRRRPARPAGLDRRHRRRARPDALRLDPAKLMALPDAGPGLPGARRRVGLRQEPLHRAPVDHRRAARDQLRLPADDRGRVRRHRHRGPARRRPDYFVYDAILNRKQHAVFDAEAAPVPLDARRGARAAGGRSRRARRPRPAGVRRRAPGRLGERARRRPVRRDRRAWSCAPTRRSSSSPRRTARRRSSSAWPASGSTRSPATCASPRAPSSPRPDAVVRASRLTAPELDEALRRDRSRRSSSTSATSAS